jgi:integrase
MSTISKLPNGRFKAIIRAGQRVLKTKTFTRRTDAKQWALGIEADRERLAALGEPGLRTTLSEYLPRYLREWNGHDPAREPQLRWWIAELGADTALADVTTDDVRRALERYAAGKALRPNRKPATRKEKRPCEIVATSRSRTPATVNRQKAALSSFFKHAIGAGLCRTNPVTGIAARAENNRRTRWLSDDERSRLLDAARKSEWPMLYLLVLSALMTGARKGELLSLRWERIDFQRRTVLLPTTKNGSPRTLTLPRPVIEEMLRHRRVSGLVFASDTNPFRAASVEKPWGKALTTASIEGFRFHDLRHSAASYLANAGATLLEIGAVLGHRSTQTTLRYAHLSVEHTRELTDRVLGAL